MRWLAARVLLQKWAEQPGRIVAAVSLWAPEPTVTNDIWLAYRVRDRQRPEAITARDAFVQDAVDQAR